jgi:hypothetical protein
MGVGPTGRGGGRDLFGAVNPSSRTSGMRMCAQSFWLAKREMKHAWLSYVASAAIIVFLGSVAAISLSFGLSEFETMIVRGPGMEAFYGAFFSDYLFLLVCAVLGANGVLLGYYAQNRRGTFARKLRPFRNMPVSAVVLVGSRALGALFALVVGALAFFVPVFFLSDLGEELGVKTYLCFCAVWVGYGLLGSGISLFFEFGTSGRVYTLISYGFAIPLMIAVVLLETTGYAGLVGRVSGMAQGGHGALLACFSILLGGAAFLLLSRARVHRLLTRELPA